MSMQSVMMGPYHGYKNCDFSLQLEKGDLTKMLVNI